MITLTHRRRGAERPSQPTPWPGAQPVLAAVVALLAVAACTAISWFVESPPAPLPAAAPTSDFSAERAWTHLERIAGGEPTPIGSAAGDAVRDHLVAELSALGLAVEVQRGAGLEVLGTVAAGRVENVIATLPGTASTGRLLLGAHYDSTFSGPGASDDKASVAAVLEAARALAAGPRLRNDIVLLLTDGEEPGLLGASAYVRQHPDGRVPGVFLNWEGPGNAGSSAVFQTSAGAAGIVAALADDARYPVGDSLVPSLLHLLSNHTDLNVLSDAGYEGLAFGFVDGRAYYHSAQDTVANFDPASLQQHGGNLLALARSFGERDLAELFADSDATFFTVFGEVVAYPNGAVGPLAVVALAAVVGLGALARRRGLTTVPRLLAGAAAGLLPLASAAVAGTGLWELLVWIQPGYAAMAAGDPYQPLLYRLAIGALAAAVVLAWFVALRRRIGGTGMAIGGLLWPALIGVALAWAAPGMAFAATVPALLAACGGLVALAIAGTRPLLALAACTAGVAPAVLVLLNTARSTLQGGGIAMGGAGALLVALAGLVVLPLLVVALPTGRAGRRAAVLLPGLAALLAVALTASGLAVDRFDARHPLPTHLLYVLDADAGTARWVSTDAQPHDWVRRHAPDEAVGDGAPLPYWTRARWTGPADVAPLAAPELTVLDSRPAGGATVVDLRLRSPRDAEVLTLHADRPVDHVEVSGTGVPAVAGSPQAAEPGGPGPFLLQFYDAPPDGITVRLTVTDPAGLRLTLSDYTAVLSGLPGFTPRPPELTRSTMHDSDLAVVTRNYRL